jgi:DNA-binding FadR family transcriptional regulator
MKVVAVTPRSLSEAVFEQLRDQILSGDIPPGTPLPAERSLCEQFGVNRAALREALKRLQQLRLVAVKQGESTRVLDPRDGGLELLVSMVFDRHGRVRAPVIRSFIEMRSALGPDIARLAAARRSDSQLAALDAALEAMEAARPGDHAALQREHMKLWATLVEASGNVAYQLMFNTMAEIWNGVGDLAAPILADELGDRSGYRTLVRAITRKQGAAAVRAARRLVERGSAAMLSVLGGEVPAAAGEVVS